MMRNPRSSNPPGLALLAALVLSAFCLLAAPAYTEPGDDEPASEETLREIDASMADLGAKLSTDIQTQIEERTLEMLTARTTAQLAAAREQADGRVARAKAPADAPRTLSNCEFVAEFGYSCTVVAARLPEPERTPSLWDAMPAAPADD